MGEDISIKLYRLKKVYTHKYENKVSNEPPAYFNKIIDYLKEKKNYKKKLE